VSQISPPIRIVLIGAAVFLAAWFTVLKPKPVTAETATAAPAATPQTTYGKAVAKAKAVAGQATGIATATATPAAAGAATATATPAPAAEPAVAIPAETLAKLPKRVATALQEHKTLVLGIFDDAAKPWRSMADDDRYTRNALRTVNRYDGDVVIATLGIADLSTYGPLVNDLGVKQSPSVVVIDHDLKGRLLTGYTDRTTINQVLADVERAPATDAYIRFFNTVCGNYDLNASRWSRPTVRGKQPTLAALKRQLAYVQRSRATVTARTTPAKYKLIKAGWLKGLDATTKSIRADIAAVKGGRKTSGATQETYDAWRTLDRKFNALGFANCAVNRQN
jgi:hypothetical protein